MLPSLSTPVSPRLRDPVPYTWSVSPEALIFWIPLEPATYANPGGPAATGRYLFLRPDLADALRVLDVPGGGELVEPFERAMVTLLAAWDAGSFPPRLFQHDRDEEPAACAACDVKEACLRGDSGARLRVGKWMGRLSSEPSADLSETAAARIWQLAGAEP